MKCIFCTSVVLLQLVFFCAYSQISLVKASKPVLDTSVLSKWPTVNSPTLSRNGSFAMFSINNIPAGKRTQVFRSLKGDWKEEIVGVKGACFTNDNREIIYLNSGDSLGIIDLTNFQAKFLSGVQSFKTSAGDKQWLAFLSKTNKTLTVESLSSGYKKIFDSVLDYHFSPMGNFLLVKRELKLTDSVLQELVWMDLKSENVKPIWEGFNAENFVFSPSDSSMAFLIEKFSGNSKKSDKDKAIVYYIQGASNSISLIDNTSKGIDSNLAIDRIHFEGFNTKGNLLFFTLKEKEDFIQNTYNVKLDVWSYFDSKIQPTQLNEARSINYFAVFNLEKQRITTVLPNDVTRVILSKRSKSVGIVAVQEGEGSEWNWNKTSKPELFYYNFESGENKPIFKGVKNLFFLRDAAISPEEKYIIITDQERRNIYTYDLKSSQVKNITESLTIPDNSTENDQPWIKQSKDLAVDCWLQSDKSVLIHDEYDIWKIDPSGVEVPKNITGGYGRKHNIVFRMLHIGPNAVQSNSELTLLAFNRTTKENGFYKISLDNPKKLSVLSIGNYLYYVSQYDVFGQPVVKSNCPNVYVFQRQSTTNSPNYYWSSNFIEFFPITNLHPEANYNWVQSKLVHFYTTNGHKEAGVLYTPENFDSTKKYPVVINYYSIRSNELNLYHEPGSENGFLDISWFASHGYVILTPDIHYKIGTPGESVLTTIAGAAKFLATLPWVDPTKIGIQGHSLGGWETNYLVTHTHLFAAACASSGMSNFVSNYLQQLSDHSNFDWYENRICRIGATLWQKPGLYIENSPIFHADFVTTPLLMINNKNDQNVQFDQGLEFFLGLRRLGKKVWMLQYDGGSHGVDGKARIDYIMRMTQFFNYYLKGEPAPEWMVKGIPANRKGIDSGLSLEPKGSRPGPSLLEKSQEDGFRVLGAIKD